MTGVAVSHGVARRGRGRGGLRMRQAPAANPPPPTSANAARRGRRTLNLAGTIHEGRLIFLMNSPPSAHVGPTRPARQGLPAFTVSPRHLLPGRASKVIDGPERIIHSEDHAAS